MTEDEQWPAVGSFATALEAARADVVKATVRAALRWWPSHAQLTILRRALTDGRMLYMIGEWTLEEWREAHP